MTETAPVPPDAVLLPPMYMLPVSDNADPDPPMVNVVVDTTSGDVGDVNVTLPPGDANNDNHVDIVDLGFLADHYNSDLGDGVYDAQEDFNGDGHVDIVDLGILADNYNTDGDP